MEQRRRAETHRRAPRFVGSSPDGPDQVLIELRGDLGAELLDRLATHIKDAIRSGTRFLVIDLSAVPRSDPGLLALLGRTQRRLARRQGLLTVRGLRPHLLPDAGLSPGSLPRDAVEDRPAHDAPSPGAKLTARRVGS